MTPNSKFLIPNSKCDLTSLVFRSAEEVACDEFAASFAAAMGDSDPFACPAGSTNTIFEHVFYTGTTNAPFAYPSDTADTAVLVVTVSGVGSGELRIGDRVVPLLARPRPRLLMGANGAPDPTATTLRVPTPKGTVQTCFLRVPESLEVALSSAEFVYGQRPTFLHPFGWFAFPNTKAKEPCIHDLNSREVDVVLDPGFAADGLACTWNGTASVGAVSTGVRSATLFGRFSPSSTAPVTYTLSHPLYICGRRTYAQTARYCPRVDDDSVLPEGDGKRFAEEYDRRLCGDLYDHSGCMVPNCDCPCHLNDLPAADSDCDVHHCPYADCEALHRAAYEEASALPPQPGLLLLLREPPLADGIDLEAPPPGPPCCPCPDHRKSPLALAAKTLNLAVRDEAWAKFVSTNADCTVFVRGLSPSHAVDDSVAVFCRTGVVTAADVHRYTVLGVRIESDEDGVDVRALKRLNPSFGLPVVVKGETPAAYLRLNAAVRLPEGNVHLAFTNATARFRLAIGDEYGERTLLDTAGKDTLDLSLAKWQSIAALTDYGDGAVVRLYAYGKGRVDLDFGYAKANGPCGIRDADRLRITSVNPPLLPDYNRDGRIDAQDVTNYANGAVFRYWTNQDTEKGNFVGESSDVRPNLQDDPLLASVKGRVDLVNLFPLALDLKPFVEAYGDSVVLKIENPYSGDVLYSSFADVPWRLAGSIQTDDVRTVGGSMLCESPLVRMGSAGYVVPNSLVRSFAAGSGLIVAEASLPMSGPLTLTVAKGGVEALRFELPVLIRPVRELYRFYSLRGAEASGGEFVLPARIPPPCLPGEKNQDIFFTHGFNVSESDSRKWGDALFKRFWLAGSNARFNMVTWAGNYNWTGDWANGLHYQQDVYQALMTGDAMKRLVEREQPDSSKRILMTQSLGNMVACEALKEGLHVAKYFMFDAAVPSESVDGTLRAESSSAASFPKYVSPEWRDYTNVCWASNWYRFFEDDPDDARGRMGWTERFTAALGNAGDVYNYYSTGDEVFHETAEPPWLLEGMTESSANYCWQKQETLKGSCLPAGTAYGGWGFATFASNRFYVYDPADEAVHVHVTCQRPWVTDRYFLRTSSGLLSPITVSELKSRFGVTDDELLIARAHFVPPLVPISTNDAQVLVADGSITNNPVFDRGFSPMFDPSAAQSDQFLALAKYVPAVSSPVGGNPVLPIQSNNIDMNDPAEGVPRPNGWGRPAVKNQYPWLHSDMKDVAYYFVYKLYESLIVKGGLK